MRRSRFAVLGMIAVLGLLGCSDSKKKSNPVGELCVEMAPDPTPVSGVSTRVGAQSDCDVVEVEFLATNVTDVHAFSTVITYDRDVVALIDFTTDGSFLASDGTQLQVIVQELEPGELTVGIARNASAGIDVTGTEVLVKMLFIGGPVRDTGSMTLTDECLLDSQEPPMPIGIVCNGGTFVVDEI